LKWYFSKTFPLLRYSIKFQYGLRASTFWKILLKHFVPSWRVCHCVMWQLISEMQSAKFHAKYSACFRIACDRLLGRTDQLQTARGSAAAAQGRQVQPGARRWLPRQWNVPLDVRRGSPSDWPPNVLPKLSAPTR